VYAIFQLGIPTGGFFMAHQNPVVVSVDGKKHETLGSGDTLAPGSIPISAESGNGLSVKSDGLFAEPGGGGGGLSEVAHNNSLSGAGTTGSPLAVHISDRAGNAIKLLDLATSEGGLFAALASGGLPAVPQTVVDSQTPSTTVQAAMLSLLQNPATAAASTQWNNVTYTDYPGWTGQVRLTTIPADTGKYLLLGGDLNHPEQDVVSMAWASDDGTKITTLFESENTGPTTDDSLQGDGVVASLGVRLSKASDNALKLIPDSESSSESGLYVPPAQSLKRGTGGGNFSFGYPDSKSARNACGKMGTGVYWKVTFSLDKAGAGNVAVVSRIWTNNIPCMEDGTLVPYQIVTDYVAANNNAVPSVAVWLICMGVPTHLMSITDGTLEKLQRADNGLTNGLDDLYPLAPEGEYAQEPQWRHEYFYTA
jgi:hypothetical protein